MNPPTDPQVRQVLRLVRQHSPIVQQHLNDLYMQQIRFDLQDLAVEGDKVKLFGIRARLQFYEHQGTLTACHIYYGGLDGEPLGEHHGHIIVRGGEIVRWLAPDGHKNERSVFVS